MSIKLFTKGKYRHIIIKDSVDENDINSFIGAFDFIIDRYEITFLNIASIPKSIVEMLYKVIHVKKIQAIIYVSSNKLSKYLKDININCLPLSYSDIKANVELKNVEAVVIGGSADSLENIIALTKTIPLVDISIFIVQHIKSDSPLILDKILQTYTSYKVKYSKNDEKIQKGVIYLTPPDYHMVVKDENIELNKNDKVNFARPSISVLFESVSKVYKNGAIAIITCGYGNDGSDVLKQLIANGSTVIIHEESECVAKEMLINAKKTKYYDLICTIDEMRGFFSAVLQTTVNKEDSVNIFLKQIHMLYGYDFTKYDRQSINRRISASMIKQGISSFSLFVKETLTKRNIFNELLLSISINVTEFFRRPQLYIALKKLLKKEFDKNSNVKIWVAGSSTGQEAYSISMLLHDIHMNNKSLIYATDFNSVVVSEAINGIYAKDKLHSCKVNSDLVLDSDFYDYFDENEAYLSVKESVKKKVLFFTHNLVIDGSFNHFDIISCKNVLIYFTPDLQEIVLQLFYDSLDDNGYLLLGESEMLHEAFNGRFIPYDKTNKIYKKVA